MTNPSDNATLSFGLRIYPTHVVQYAESDNSRRDRSQLQIENQKNLLRNKLKGEISYKAAKRIRNAVNWLVSASPLKSIYCKRSKAHYKFKVNFITLTLPSIGLDLTDHQFKNKLLKNWIAQMKYRHNLSNYVWKVETQKNGNIHAHITTDCFIHYAEIRETWNALLIKNGFMKSFADKFHHSDPNSTDVKCVRSIDNLAGYLAKYFSKSEDERRKVQGRLWGCSHSLSDSNKCNIIINPTDDDHVLEPLASSNAETFLVESEPNAFGRKKLLAKLYIMSPVLWQDIKKSVIGQHFFNHLNNIRNSAVNSNLLKFTNYGTKFSIFNYSAENRKSDSENYNPRISGEGVKNTITSIKAILPKFIQSDLFQPINIIHNAGF